MGGGFIILGLITSFTAYQEIYHTTIYIYEYLQSNEVLNLVFVEIDEAFYIQFKLPILCCLKAFT